MCDQYGTCCRLCKLGLVHDEPKPERKRAGEYMRKHNHLALLVGENQVAEMEQHYANHGVHVTHRKTECGDYAPVVTSHSDWAKLCESRGFPHVAG